MDVNYSNRSMVQYALPDLLEKFYTAAVLKPFAERLLNPLFPGLAALEKPRKRDIIEAFMTLQASPKLLQRFVDSFPPSLKAATQALLWTRGMTLAELEAQLGTAISRRVVDIPHIGRNDFPFELLPEFCLIAFSEVDGYYTRYSASADKANYMVMLPPALQEFLKPAFPPPKYFNWEPRGGMKEIPPEVIHFNCESHIAGDLALIGDFLNRGSLTLTKAGSVTVGSLRTVMGLTSGKEFFSGLKDASRKLPELRHSLLLQAILKMDPDLRELIGKQPFPMAKVFGNLISALFGNGELLVELLLPHIRRSSSYYQGEYRRQPLEHLRKLFASLPSGDWIVSENLLKYPFYRSLDILPITLSHYRFRADPKSNALRGYFYGSSVDLTQNNAPDIVMTPLLLGCVFLLAAFGLMELYTLAPPAHPLWRAKGESFLTPFDGLIAFRLTPAGAFAFGKTKTLDLPVPEKRAAAVQLHPERLLATCRNADPLTINAMDEFMERLSPGLYRLTADTFLSGCLSKADLKERIDAFRQRVPAEIPPFWEATFRQWLDQPSPFSPEQAYDLYRIADDPGLRRLFASDPVLRSTGLKVEGFRIAATTAQIKRIRERLRSLGYLLDDGRLPGKPAAKKKTAKKMPRKRRWRY